MHQKQKLLILINREKNLLKKIVNLDYNLKNFQLHFKIKQLSLQELKKVEKKWKLKINLH